MSADMRGHGADGPRFLSSDFRALAVSLTLRGPRSARPPSTVRKNPMISDRRRRTVRPYRGGPSVRALPPPSPVARQSRCAKGIWTIRPLEELA